MAQRLAKKDIITDRKILTNLNKIWRILKSLWPQYSGYYGVTNFVMILIFAPRFL